MVMREKYHIKWEYQIPKKVFHQINKAMENLNFSDALNMIWAIITEANQRIDMERPWDLAKTNTKRLSELISGLLETLTEIGGLIEPFMPETARKIINQLETGKIEPLFPRKK